jgi:hypothetical protein
MNPPDLDAMKSAWKNEKSFDDRRLSEADIERFLHKGSKDTSQLFRKGLYFDILFKSVIGASLIGLMILYRENLVLILILGAIILLLLSAIRYQWLTIGRIPESRGSGPVIRETLENKISFYRTHYIKSLFVGALSNALLIVSGMLYYLYFKYGELRPFTWEDYLVLGSVILIGYFFGAYVQIAQHNFHVRQLESCLQEIDENIINTYTLRKQKNRKRLLILIFVLAIVCGLLLLAYLVFS